jgi:hypothetical protein
MPKNPTKKASPKAVKKPDTRTSAPTTVAPPPAATATTTSQRAKPRPAAARYRRASLTAAQRRGADLVRYLRIHSKKPFARRGEEAIRKLAIEVGHLANIELNSIAPGRES